ncbi:MAG: zinc ribbon domain-containing protein [Candidatus Gastranaerophilales bacterium]
MECPKCSLEIDDNTIVCPNCKKVLKLICPICKCVNTSNSCKKCGYTIITKCSKCGKINQTFTKKCRKCGSDTEKSVIKNEANGDDFALMTVNFLNVSDMKSILGNAKLYNIFKVTLDKLVFDFAKTNGLRCQLIEQTYVIRFTQDYTYKTSALNASKASIELLNSIAKMNCKLTKKKNATIKCNIFLMKRSVEDDPNNINSGNNINLLGQDNSSDEDKVLNTMQVLVTQEIYDIIENDYKISPLNTILIGDKMTTFYEIDVKDLVILEFPEEEVPEDEIKIPNFVQNMLVEQDKIDGHALKKLDQPVDPDAIYDIKTFDLEQINAEFIRTENIDVFYHIAHRLQANPNSIIAMKTADLYKPYSLKIINAIQDLDIYNNIITITCYDEMKYSPYSFFRDLVAAIFEYTVSQKLYSQNDFSMFASIDPDGLVKDLITLKERNFEATEDTRVKFFNIFFTLLEIIPKTLIFIENYEKIDASSQDVMKFVFETFEQLDISFLISHEKNFSVHEKSHFLVTRPYYTEITLKPTSFEKLIEENKEFYRNILDNFYFQRVAKYSCGSILFIDIAIQYLIESGVFEMKKDSIEMINPKTIIIPSNLKNLMKRRINLLKDNMEAFNFITTVVLLGTRVDENTIRSFNFENINEIYANLTQMGFIYFYNNCIYFPNYNLLRECLLDVIDKISLEQIIDKLFKVAFVDEMPSPVKADLFKMIKNTTAEREEWEKLAKINLSLGDFSSYLNCTAKILELIELDNDEEHFEENEKYKLELYENIANNLYEYVPEKTSEIAEIALANLEKSMDTDKIVLLCNKMIQGNLVVGNYAHALELTHKVLSLLPSASLNPDSPDFNSYFYLMSLLHIQILFNIGAISDCLDVGFKVLNVTSEATLDKLKPDYFSKDDFRILINTAVGYVALANVMMLSGNVDSFLNIVRNDLNDVPASYDIFIMLQDILHGYEPRLIVDKIDDNDTFGVIIANMLSAFSFAEVEPVLFAENFYKAKIFARAYNIHLLELFADLMIAKAYIDVDSFEKAEAMILKIISASNENGMTTLLYVAWYMMSCLKLRQHQYDVAFGIINNSLIQLEKNSLTSEYLLVLFKYNMFKTMMYKKEFDKAQICIEQAHYLATKFGINFTFDINPDSYITAEEFEENSVSDNNHELDNKKFVIANESEE